MVQSTIETKEFTFPCLLESRTKNEIVLFNSEWVGVVVYSDKAGLVGSRVTGSGSMSSLYELFPGKLKLRN